jgi:hypothetical protein
MIDHLHPVYHAPLQGLGRKTVIRDLLMVFLLKPAWEQDNQQGPEHSLANLQLSNCNRKYFRHIFEMHYPHAPDQELPG